MNWKAVIALLLAALIVLLGGWLPRLEARRQDAISENTVLFAPVEAVELEFTQTEMTLEQTLRILAGLRGAVEIPEELASLKREKVEKIVRSTVEKYAEAGVLLADTGEDELLLVQSLLYYGPENRSNVFWQIHWGSEAHSFALVIDDRTGMVCSVEYMAAEEHYEDEAMGQVLSSFLQLHLKGMGDTFFDYPAQTLMDGAKQANDGSYVATELIWESVGKLTFFVNRSGFYTYFS